jgi:hypothetical protein
VARGEQRRELVGSEHLGRRIVDPASVLVAHPDRRAPQLACRVAPRIEKAPQLRPPQCDRRARAHGVLAHRAGRRIDSGRYVEREHRRAARVHRRDELRAARVQRQPRVEAEHTVQHEPRTAQYLGVGRERTLVGSRDQRALARIAPRRAPARCRIAVHDAAARAGVRRERRVRIAPVVAASRERDDRAVAARVAVDQPGDRFAGRAHQRDLALARNRRRIDRAHLRGGNGSHPAITDTTSVSLRGSRPPLRSSRCA